MSQDAVYQLTALVLLGLISQKQLKTQCLIPKKLQDLPGITVEVCMLWR